MIESSGIGPRPAVPTRFVDRWGARKDLRPGDGVLYWHVLMSQAPEIRTGAVEAQRRLAGFPGLHLTPLAWLHMTIVPICGIHELASAEAAAVVAAARERLATLPAIGIDASQLLYHPEAIVLRLRPGRRLALLADTVIEATATALPGWNANRRVTKPWIPHVTIAYSTADQPASPIVAAAGQSIAPRRGVVNEVALVEQWGPERSWDWRVVDTVSMQLPTADPGSGFVSMFDSYQKHTPGRGPA